MTTRTAVFSASRRQILRFCTVGGITTALDMLLFAALAEGAGLPAAAANIASYSCGIVASFALNRAWTFGDFASDGPAPRQALRFVATYLVAMALSTALVVTLSQQMPEMAAKVLSVPLVFLWSFSVTRSWVFR